MAKIRVEISSLRENEKSLEKQIASSEQLSRRLESLLNRIEASWEGDASAAYIRVMRQYAAQAASMRRRGMIRAVVSRLAEPAGA